MLLRLIRNATLLIDVAGRRLLVDPMLNPAGAVDPVVNTANPRRNPVVDLPLPAEKVVAGVRAGVRPPPPHDHPDAPPAAPLPQDPPPAPPPAAAHPPA